MIKTILLCLLLCRVSMAGELLTPFYLDSDVPLHCQYPVIDHFSKKTEYVTLGTRGGLERGYHVEHPLSRIQIAQLWRWLKKPDQLRREESQTFNQSYFLLAESYKKRGFTLNKERDLLILLHLLALQEKYPRSHYYGTHQVAYHHRGAPVKHSIDILVGDRTSCQILLVGTVGLGIHKANVSQNELYSIRRFIKYYLKEY